MGMQYPIIGRLISLELLKRKIDYTTLFSLVGSRMKKDYYELEFNEEIFSNALGELGIKKLVTCDIDEEKGEFLWRLTEKGNKMVREKTRKAKENREAIEKNTKDN